MTEPSFLEQLENTKLQHKADNLGVDVETLKIIEQVKQEANQQILKSDDIKSKIIVHKFKKAQADKTVNNVLTFEDVEKKTKYTISVNVSVMGVKLLDGSTSKTDEDAEKKLLMLQETFTEFLANIPDKVLT